MIGGLVFTAVACRSIRTWS